jgi:hypothetical protein
MSNLPMKLVAFPKLIDQRKNNESSKSFLKINNIGLNDNYNNNNNNNSFTLQNQSINNSILITGQGTSLNHSHMVAAHQGGNGWDTRN